MNQQEFNKIYPKNITPGQHEVLDCWLKGLSDQEIATKLDIGNDAVRGRFSEIFTRFKLPTEKRKKVVLMQLFIYYKPDLIPYEHKKKLAETGQYYGLYLRHYVERSPIEENVRQKIQNGSSLRIKGLNHTGKTYLLNKVIIPEAKRLGYLTVNLSLGIANTSNLNDEDKFFKWLCDSIKIELKSQLKSILHEENYQNHLNLETKTILEEMLKKLESLDYLKLDGTGQAKFKEYIQTILGSIKPKCLLLALDDVDYVFEYNDVANSLGQILRNILVVIDTSCKGLCLVILHSTESYAKLSKNHSPFDGIGIPCILGDFNRDQIKELLYQYKIKWEESELNDLINLVGGHPFLIIKAFEDSKNQNITPKDLLKDAETNSGIYASLFLKQLEIFNIPENSRLKEKFRQVVMSEEKIELDIKSIFLLQSMGLIKVSGDYVSPRCQLYRKYFNKELNRED
jgi:hypothetical protein